MVQAVRGQLSPAQAPVLVTSRTTAESHALYLQGLSEYNRWTPESARRAVGLYELCLEIDPGYAPATTC